MYPHSVQVIRTAPDDILTRALLPCTRNAWQFRQYRRFNSDGIRTRWRMAIRLASSTHRRLKRGSSVKKYSALLKSTLILSAASRADSCFLVLNFLPTAGSPLLISIHHPALVSDRVFYQTILPRVNLNQTINFSFESLLASIASLIIIILIPAI